MELSKVNKTIFFPYLVLTERISELFQVFNHHEVPIGRGGFDALGADFSAFVWLVIVFEGLG